MKKYILEFLFIFMFILIYIPVPYRIETTGGLINVEDRIKIKDSYSSTGSINMTYVREIKPNIYTLLIAKISKNQDIIKVEETDITDATSKLLLEEAKDNAILVAFNRLGKKYNIKSKEVVIAYIYEDAKTNLKIGDVLKKIDDYDINEVDDLKKITEKYNVGDKIVFEVENNSKTYKREAIAQEYNNKPYIGILAIENIDFDLDINYTFKQSESGSSGGLMSALSIYNSLTKKDYTNGLKISGTGAINRNGDAVPISGVKHKLRGAVENNADIFFVPNGENYSDAIKEQKENKYDIQIVGIDNFDDIIEYLK